MTGTAMTKTPEIGPARLEHLSQLVTLLASAVPDCAPQTVWDIPWSWPSYWVVTAGGRVAATGSLRFIDEDYCELRGLTVHSDFRGQGLARRLVDRLLREARLRSYDTLCVTRSPEFFRRLGFVPTHPFWLALEPARWPQDGQSDRVPMIAERGSSEGRVRRPRRLPEPLTTRYEMRNTEQRERNRPCPT